MNTSANKFTDAQVKAIEAKLGRRMTDREMIFGALIRRVDLRTPAEAAGDHNWAVKMAPVAEPTMYDDAIAAEEAEVARNAGMRDYISLDEDGRRLFNLKDGREKELQKRADAQATEAHLIAKASKLKALQDLEESIRWDLNWDAAETETVRRARLQLETPGADADEADKLFKAAFGIDRQKKSEQKKAVEARIEQFNAQKAELDRSIAALDLQTGTKSKFTVGDINALWNKYASADKESPEGAEALDQWNNAVDDFGGLDAFRAAEEGGGA